MISKILVPLFALSMFAACVAEDVGPELSDERGISTRGKADAPGSCEAPDGSDFCGVQSADGCWCDDECVGFGDCCSDRAPVCEAPVDVPGTCEGACGGQSDDGCWCDDQCAGMGDCCEDKTEICEEEPEPEPEPTACAGNPRYRVTFSPTWNPSGVPNPHWSPIVGSIHSGDADFWSLGGLATNGIEVMAESGATGPLVAEVNAAVNAGDALAVILGTPIDTPAGSTTVTFDADADNTRVTLVSMMAPSPDWFVGVDGVNLCPDGEWLSGNVNLVVHDAGTDSGTNFTSADSDTNPAAAIGPASRFVQNGQQQSLGTMNFQRIQ